MDNKIFKTLVAIQLAKTQSTTKPHPRGIRPSYVNHTNNNTPHRSRTVIPRHLEQAPLHS